MKRFLIALLFCLVPFSARAYRMFEFLVDVYRVYDSIFGEKKEDCQGLLQTSPGTVYSHADALIVVS